MEQHYLGQNMSKIVKLENTLVNAQNGKKITIKIRKQLINSYLTDSVYILHFPTSI